MRLFISAPIPVDHTHAARGLCRDRTYGFAEGQKI
jgi:hypothetical protein